VAIKRVPPAKKKDLNVVARYDGETRQFVDLCLLMTNEQELSEGWTGGSYVTLGGIDYVLGTRQEYGHNRLITYSLHTRNLK
jgi:hypothetical protein